MPALSFIVGILGNIISILMYSSSIGTFRGIIKKKSIQDYKSTPYIITLLSTCLWTFYGIQKPDGLLIYSINGIGTVFQIIYITLFLIYAPKQKRIFMMKMLALLNVGVFGLIVAITFFALHGSVRLIVVGCLCAALTIAMYAAPLGAMRMVVKTKSVEYMPFFLSLFLFINAGVWTMYAVLVKDLYVGVPNLIGFFLGMSQLIIYAIYRKGKKASESDDEEKGSNYLVATDGVEMKSKNTSIYKDLSLPKMSISSSSSENGVKSKIAKAMSLSSYELQAIVLSNSKEHYDVV